MLLQCLRGVASKASSRVVLERSHRLLGRSLTAVSIDGRGERPQRDFFSWNRNGTAPHSILCEHPRVSLHPSYFSSPSATGQDGAEKVPGSDGTSTSADVPKVADAVPHSRPTGEIAASLKEVKKQKETSMMEIVRSLWSVVLSKQGDGYFPGLYSRIALAGGLLISAKVANIQVPHLFGSVVDVLNTPGDVVLVPMSLLLMYGAARTGASLFNELRNAVFSKVAQSAIRGVARRTFLHLHKLDLSFHLQRETGGLSRAIDRGSRGINSVLSAVLMHIVPTLFEISLVCAILSMKCGPQFAAVTVATIGAYTAFTLGITSWRTKFRQHMNRMDNEAATKAIDSLINYETVKYFNNEEMEASRYDQYLQQYQKSAMKVQSSLSLLNWGQNFIFTAALTTVMVMAANSIAAGTMTVGDMVLVNGLLFQLSMPLNFLGSVYRDLRQSLTDMETMFNLLKENATVVNKEGCLPLDVSKGASISFHDVSFGYLPERQILDGLTFTVNPGSTIAFVGFSGSGKSTIARLLYRFYDPKRGTVCIDGQDLRDVELDSLRRAIGIIPQDTVLFNDTIFYNIAYGNPDATEEEVYEAAKLAHIHEAIERMPLGYETKVGERGLKLSGGEKQRVAIARVILKNAPILICDEATSALDSHTEKDVLRSLSSLSKNRTTLMIAHRLSSVVDADEIVVLGERSVLERGSHSELLAMGGAYSRLWKQQQS